MKLASRCTACGTLFSVIRDQLWVCGGRVRCGYCGTAFNAFDQLYDLEQGKPPPWLPEQLSGEAVPTTVAPAAAAAVHQAAAADEPLSAATEVPAAAEDATPPSPEGGPLAEPAGAAPLEDTETLRFDTPAGAPWDAAAAREPVPVAAAARSAEQPHSTADASASHAASASQAAAGEDATTRAADVPVQAVSASTETPSFIRHAERRARWSRPGVRIALGAATAVLAVTLLLQGALHFRDRLSAHSAPAARILAWWCARSGCTIGPPRRISDLTVESSALLRLPGEDGLVRLALTVRNRGSVVAALPALEMSLTDASGKVVVRRAVRLSEMAGAPGVLPPQVDVPLQLVFATGGQRIAGFTVELFYP